MTSEKSTDRDGSQRTLFFPQFSQLNSQKALTNAFPFLIAKIGNASWEFFVSKNNNMVLRSYHSHW